MKRLNVKQVADLQNVPLHRLLDHDARRWSATRPAIATDYGWQDVPAVPFDPVATEVSADIPLMIGSTETEITWNAGQQYDPLDDAELARPREAELSFRRCRCGEGDCRL